MILGLLVALIAFIAAKLVFNSSSHSKFSRTPPSGNLIIFDTVTNGLPLSWKADIFNISNWPRIVSISWYKIAPDGRVLGKESHIINPAEFTYKFDAVQVHGITQEYAVLHGSYLKEVLEKFEAAVSDASYLIAHNIEFDFPVILSEYSRSRISQTNLLSLKRICTMKSSKEYCNIKTPRGLKYPKLEELYQKLFRSPLPITHNSMNDAEACMKCFKELYNKNILKF